MPMHLKRFKHFTKYLQGDEELQQLVESIEVYRYCQAKW